MSTFDLIAQDIEEYCEAHTTPEDALLYRLNRQTYLQTINPRMCSGHLQGQFLTLLSKMMRPKYVLEIGTFTGYSAICLAAGLADGGELHTIESNPEYEDRIREYLAQSPVGDRIVLHIGDAKEVVPTLEPVWDLVFIDAEKEDYRFYYDKVLPHVRQGGFILVDNVLWNGKVTQDLLRHDRDTEAIMEFNDYVQQDDRVRNMLLPFRDGIMMIEKR